MGSIKDRNGRDLIEAEDINKRWRRKGKIYPTDAEFQRIARREKAFESEQCKEMKKKNRMGKTRDLFKKIRDTKGTLHVKMGSIKDRNDTDLTESRRY